MLNLVNSIISLILVFSCNGSGTPTVKSPNNSLQIQSSAKEALVHLRTEADTTVTVSYAAIECGCPQWFENKFRNKSFLKGVERFYLEPMNKTLVNANALWNGHTLPLTLKLVGRFSKNKEFPQTYNTKTTPEKARIFCYNKIINISSSRIKSKE